MKPGFIHLKPFTTQVTDLLLFLAWCFLVLLCWPVVIVASLIRGAASVASVSGGSSHVSLPRRRENK